MSKDMMPKLTFEGKTILKVDTSACNVWTFQFTDGTSASIEVHCLHPTWGLYGIELVKETLREAG